MYLIVQEETLLDTVDVQVSLKRVDNDESLVLFVNNLIIEKGHIMALPSSLYKINSGEVCFLTSAARSFQRILLEQSENANEVAGMTDNDWALLVEDY